MLVSYKQAKSRKNLFARLGCFWVTIMLYLVALSWHLSYLSLITVLDVLVPQKSWRKSAHRQHTLFTSATDRVNRSVSDQQQPVIRMHDAVMVQVSSYDSWMSDYLKKHSCFT